MNKNNVLVLATILALSLGNCVVSNVFAEEVVNGTISDEGFDATEPTDTIDTISVDNADDTETVETIDESTDGETSSELENDIIHEGTSGEAEVVCASADEPGCEDPAIDPEMWPLYLSLGALGATILLVLIINLIGHRKK